MNETKRFSVRYLTFIALCVAINIVGSKIAFYARIPIYLDSIGTILCSAVLGPVYGIVGAIAGGLISGVMGDIYAIYFLPGAICTGLVAGLVLYNRKKTMLCGIWKAFLISFPCSVVIALINAKLFGGVTSSSSDIFTQLFYRLGVSLELSCFITQIFTDYADKLVAVLLICAVYRRLPLQMILGERH